MRFECVLALACRHVRQRGRVTIRSIAWVHCQNPCSNQDPAPPSPLAALGGSIAQKAQLPAGGKRMPASMVPIASLAQGLLGDGLPPRTPAKAGRPNRASAQRGSHSVHTRRRALGRPRLSWRVASGLNGCEIWDVLGRPATRPRIPEPRQHQSHISHSAARFTGNLSLNPGEGKWALTSWYSEDEIKAFKGCG